MKNITVTNSGTKRRQPDHVLAAMVRMLTSTSPARKPKKPTKPTMDRMLSELLTPEALANRPHRSQHQAYDRQEGYCPYHRVRANGVELNQAYEAGDDAKAHETTDDHAHRGGGGVVSETE